MYCPANDVTHVNSAAVTINSRKSIDCDLSCRVSILLKLRQHEGEDTSENYLSLEIMRICVGLYTVLVKINDDNLVTIDPCQWTRTERRYYI